MKGGRGPTMPTMVVWRSWVYEVQRSCLKADAVVGGIRAGVSTSSDEWTVTVTSNYL